MVSTLLVFFVFLLLSSGILAANHFTGITASNFLASGACRTSSNWDVITGAAQAANFKVLRLVGNDCDAFDLATASAASHGMKVLAGVFADSGTMAASEAQINADMDAFVTAVQKYGADAFDGITIGNEVQDDALNIMNKVWDVRGYLNTVHGIYLPVSTVHYFSFFEANPILCDADRVTANAHAFYDGGVLAPDAGNLVLNVAIPTLKNVCAGYSASQNIVITETGWPSRGDDFGAAVPSLQNELLALSSLNCAAASAPIYAFEADDSLWKTINEVERSFGILIKNGPGIDLWGTIFNSC